MTGYPLPKTLLARVAASVLTLRPRSYASDSVEAVATLRPPLVCECAGHIPERGPFLSVHNHYNAPGYRAWWNTLAISAAIAARRARGSDREVHWIITSAWRGTDDGWSSGALERRTKWTFGRVAQVYGFINMPPMPPRADETAERARSVLQSIRLARSLAGTGGIIGLSPEGRDHPGGFGLPAPGVGEFMALLVEAGLPVLPSGVRQHEGQLHVRFGPAFTPQVPPRRENRDAVVAEQVMAAIRSCL